MRKYFISFLLYFLFGSNIIFAHSPVAEFFRQKQVNPDSVNRRQTNQAAEYVMDILSGSQYLYDKGKEEDGQAAIEELFVAINNLLNNPALEHARINIEFAKNDTGSCCVTTKAAILTKENVRESSFTMQLDPAGAEYIPTLATEPIEENWPIELTQAPPALVIYHEFVHLLHYLSYYKEIMDDISWENQIYDTLYSNDMDASFWGLWREEEFKIKWENLREQITVIGIPAALSSEPRFQPLGRFCEKEIRKRINLVPRYPYASHDLEKRRIIDEKTQIILDVFQDWGPDGIKNARRP